MPKVFKKKSGDSNKITEVAEIVSPNKQPPKQRYTNFEQGLPSLQKALGYTFNDISLAKLAVTHRSYDGKINY